MFQCSAAASGTSAARSRPDARRPRVIILTYAAAVKFPIKKKGFPCLQAMVIIFPFPDWCSSLKIRRCALCLKPGVRPSLNAQLWHIILEATLLLLPEISGKREKQVSL